MQTKSSSQLSHTQRSLKYENDSVKIIVKNHREEGLLGPVGPVVAKGAEDPVSLELEHRLVTNDRRIESVKDPKSNSFLSPSSLWELASYSLGLAPETSARWIEGNINRTRKLLNATSIRRERFKSLYDCCYRERFPEDQACLRLFSYKGTYATDCALRHRLSVGLVELSRFVVPLLERSVRSDDLPKILIEELATTLQETIELSRKCRPQLLQDILGEANSVRVRFDRYFSEGLSKYSDAIYEIECDVRSWRKQVETLSDRCENAMKSSKAESLDDSSNSSTRNIMEELARIVLASRGQSSSETFVFDSSHEGPAMGDVTYEDIISIGLPRKFGVKVFFEDRDTLEQLGTRFRNPKRSGYGDAYGIELFEPVEYMRRCFKEDTTKVAVKLMKACESKERTCQRIVRECQSWSKLRHGKVLPLIGLWIRKGCDLMSKSVAFVSPWMEGGNLLDYLQQNRQTSSKLRLQFLFDVADALSYMHNFSDGEIVHGDLKATNVLIRDRTAYVCDFGLSHVSDNLEGCTTMMENPWRWQAPELLGKGQKATPEGDVYAFGCVFLEAFTGDIPWPREHRRPEKKDACPDRPPEITDDEHWSLMKDCWKYEPTLRPLSTELKTIVGVLYSKELLLKRQGDGYVDDFYPIAERKVEIPRSSTLDIVVGWNQMLSSSIRLQRPEGLSFSDLRIR